MTSSDVLNVCRTCLTNYSQENLTSIFHNINLDGEVLELQEMLEQCTKLQVGETLFILKLKIIYSISFYRIKNLVALTV